MVIVEHQDDRLGPAREGVDQVCEDQFRRQRLARTEQVERLDPETGVKGLQGSDDIGEKAREVIVAFIERQPGDVRKMKEEG